jgi:hypothetical protein
MEIRYYIAYRKILKNGNTRTYRREFKNYDKALEYARDKMYHDTCINVSGYKHEIYDGVTYCYRLAL